MQPQFSTPGEQVCRLCKRSLPESDFPLLMNRCWSCIHKRQANIRGKYGYSGSGSRERTEPEPTESGE